MTSAPRSPRSSSRPLATGSAGSNAESRPARLNYPGDLTGTELVGERGTFPYLTRDGGTQERVLEVTAATYDADRDVTVVEFAPAAAFPPV